MTPRRRLALALGAALVALVAGLTGLREFDAFHHLAMGRHLLAHGLTGPEPFLFPLAGQPPLPPPYWLGAVAFYAAQLVGGYAGVVLLSGLAAAVTIGVTASAALRPYAAVPSPADPAPADPAAPFDASSGLAEALAALLPVALAIGAWRLRAVSRPEVLGLACFAWTLHALRSGGPRARWSIPAVALLWANLHPSVAFGLGAAALALIDALRDAVVAPRDGAGSPWRALARTLGLVTLAAAVLASLAPGGALTTALAFAKALVLGGPVDPGFEVARSQIIELQPVQAAILPTPVGAMLALVPLGWLAARRRPRLGEVLLLVGLAVIATRSVRFVPWAVIAAAPLVGRDLALGVARLRARLSPGLAVTRAAAAALALGVTGAAAWSFAWLPLPVSLSPAEDLFPVRAAELLAQALPKAPGARIWNYLGAGGYLEWRLPGTQVYQDGRLSWAPGEALAALDGPASRALFTPLDERWRFDAMVADYPRLQDAQLYVAHGEDPVADRRRHALVGIDDGGLLYVRRDGLLVGLVSREFTEAVPAAPAPVERLVDPARRAALEADWRRALEERPACRICRAGLWLTLAAAGDEAGAEALLPGGRLPASSNPFGHPGLEGIRTAARALAERRFADGLSLGGRGDLRRAAEAYRASALATDSGAARANLGYALLDLGDTAGAARELGRAVALEPGLAAARYGLGLACEATGRRAEAVEAFRAFLKLEPGSPFAPEARARADRLSR